MPHAGESNTTSEKDFCEFGTADTSRDLEVKWRCSTMHGNAGWLGFNVATIPTLWSQTQVPKGTCTCSFELDGSLLLESEPLLLPWAGIVSVVQKDVDRRDQGKRMAVESEDFTTPARILVVDDEQTARELVGLILRAAGYVVV